ncbi:hypothetical protein EON67_11205 [archaeon]|nr:MAG: hypothetical protein EON67_11205 [archaeon]
MHHCAAMGQKPTEEELFQLVSEVDESMAGVINFGEFLKVIERQKERAARFDDDSDMSMCMHMACAAYLRLCQPLVRMCVRARVRTLLKYCAVDAFVACGGRADKTGSVKRSNLVKIVKHDFGLTIDIEELIDSLVGGGSARRATLVAPPGVA